MPLPKIKYPLNEIKLESLGRKVQYRPMTTLEEKLLLIAKASENENDIFTAIKQVVNNCAQDAKFDIDKLPIYELELFFLTLRIRSIGNQIELSYHDNEDDQDYKFQINLDDIKVKYPEGKVESKIKITDDIGVVMRHPPASLYDNSAFINGKDVTAISEELVMASIEKVWEGDSVYNMADASRDEVIEFLDSIETSAYRRMQEYLANTPHMEHTITYQNTKGTERKIVLRTLNDFFIL